VKNEKTLGSGCFRGFMNLAVLLEVTSNVSSSSQPPERLFGMMMVVMSLQAGELHVINPLQIRCRC
ncbi:MAG: hypothetical protein ACRC23_14200, partial [Aeromonas jandaei]